MCVHIVMPVIIILIVNDITDCNGSLFSGSVFSFILLRNSMCKVCVCVSVCVCV